MKTGTKQRFIPKNPPRQKKASARSRTNAKKTPQSPKTKTLPRELLELLIKESPVHPASNTPPRKPPFELQDD
jgi:hypothetical protein